MTASFPRGEIEGSISERFGRVARAQPERAAVREAGRVVTYAELEARAASAAAALGESSGEGEPGRAGRALRPRRLAALRRDARDPGRGTFLRSARSGASGRAAFADPLRPRSGGDRGRTRFTRSGAGSRSAGSRGARAGGASGDADVVAVGLRSARLGRGSRVRPLHFGLDRTAEGRDAEPPQRPAQRMEARARSVDPAGGSNHAALLAELRGVRVRHLRRAVDGRVRLPVRPVGRRPSAAARVSRTRGDHDLSLGSERFPEPVFDSRRQRGSLEVAHAQAGRRSRSRLGLRPVPEPLSAELRVPRRARVHGDGNHPAVVCETRHAVAGRHPARLRRRCHGGRLPRRGWQAGRGGRRGRDRRRRPNSSDRLLEGPGADRRDLPSGPRPPGCSAVPDRRPRPDASRRLPSASRPQRRPTEDSRPSRRGRRSRGRAPRDSRRPRGRGGRTARLRYGRRSAADRVGRGRTGHRDAPASPGAGTAGLHGAGDVPAAGSAATHRDGQSGPRGAAGAGPRAPRARGRRFASPRARRSRPWRTPSRSCSASTASGRTTNSSSSAGIRSRRSSCWVSSRSGWDVELSAADLLEDPTPAALTARAAAARRGADNSPGAPERGRRDARLRDPRRRRRRRGSLRRAPARAGHRRTVAVSRAAFRPAAAPAGRRAGGRLRTRDPRRRARPLRSDRRLHGRDPGLRDGAAAPSGRRARGASRASGHAVPRAPAGARAPGFGRARRGRTGSGAGFATSAGDSATTRASCGPCRAVASRICGARRGSERGASTRLSMRGASRRSRGERRTSAPSPPGGRAASTEPSMSSSARARASSVTGRPGPVSRPPAAGRRSPASTTDSSSSTARRSARRSGGGSRRRTVEGV